MKSVHKCFHYLFAIHNTKRITPITKGNNHGEAAKNMALNNPISGAFHRLTLLPEALSNDRPRASLANLSGKNSKSIATEILLGVTGTSLIHESGHYLMARALKVPATMHFQHVELFSDHRPAWKTLLIYSAGPLANVATASLALVVGAMAFSFAPPVFTATVGALGLIHLMTGITNFVPSFDASTPNPENNTLKPDSAHIKEALATEMELLRQGPELEKIFYFQKKSSSPRIERPADVTDVVKKIVAAPEVVGAIETQTAEVLKHEENLTSLSLDQLKKKTHGLKRRMRHDAHPERFLAEAIAVASEASARVLGKRPYIEQIAASIAMTTGLVVEQKTGEGKTISLLLTAYYRSLLGRVDIYTFNDYLALRDAEETAGPVFHALGIKVGALSNDKKSAYRFTPQTGLATAPFHDNLRLANTADVLRDCDVIYGTTTSFIFDRLFGGEETWKPLFSAPQSPFASALVDEMDSQFLDEATTDYRIVGDFSATDLFLYTSIFDTVMTWKNNDQFTYDASTNAITLDPKISANLEEKYEAAQQIYPGINLNALYFNAVKALYAMKLNKDYVVSEGRIEIVDQLTGRIETNRAWNLGLHSFLQIKEGVTVSTERMLQSHIALKNHMRKYRFVAGTTGTIGSSDEEFEKLYRVRSARIGPRKPSVRNDFPVKTFLTKQEKLGKLLEDATLISQGNTARPILIGCHDIAESVYIARRLEEMGLKVNLLNGTREKENEGEIIAAAGQAGAITISTQYAGRGTDIKLSSDALKAGGLHVMLTSLGPNRRVDDQLRGRAGRQGQPGSSQQYISLDEKLIQEYSEASERESLGIVGGETPSIPPSAVQEILDLWQDRSEVQDSKAREKLMEWDDALEPYRNQYLALRNSIINGKIDASLDPNLGIGFLDVLAWTTLDQSRVLQELKRFWHDFLHAYEIKSQSNEPVDDSDFLSLFKEKVVVPYLKSAKPTQRIAVSWDAFKKNITNYFRETRIKEVFDDLSKSLHDGAVKRFLRKIQSRHNTMSSDELRTCVAECQDFLSTNPNQPVLWMLKISFLLTMDRREEAETALLESLESCYDTDVKVLKNTNQLKPLSELMLKTVLKNINHGSISYRSLYLLFLAHDIFPTKESRDIIASLAPNISNTDRLLLKPRPPAVLVIMACRLGQLLKNKNWQEARALNDHILDILPGHPQFQLVKAAFLKSEDKLEEAGEHFELAVKYSAMEHPLYNMIRDIYILNMGASLSLKPLVKTIADFKAVFMGVLNSTPYPQVPVSINQTEMPAKDASLFHYCQLLAQELFTSDRRLSLPTKIGGPTQLDFKLTREGADQFAKILFLNIRDQQD